MGTWLYSLLALAVLALAAAAVGLRSARGALWAVAGTLLGLTVVALSQALPLLALAWAAAAVGAAWAAMPLPTPEQPIVEQGQGPRAITAIALAGLWLIVAGAVLLAADSPIWHEPVRRVLAAPIDWGISGLLLATRYAPGLVALGLLVLTLLVGRRVGKGAD